MTIQARYNLQRGIPQNTKQSATTYNIESDIDRLIIARIGMREKQRLIIDKKNQEDFENQVADNIVKKINSLLG